LNSPFGGRNGKLIKDDFHSRAGTRSRFRHGLRLGGAKEDPRESLPEIQRLLGAGYAVVSVEYRRADPGNPDPRKRNPYPAAWNDVADAALWVKHARGGGRFGLDSRRVATFGYSAGGTLANYLATRPITPSRQA
jgi:acetyl esterase/lipase